MSQSVSPSDSANYLSVGDDGEELETRSTSYENAFKSGTSSSNMTKSVDHPGERKIVFDVTKVVQSKSDDTDLESGSNDGKGKKETANAAPASALWRYRSGSDVLFMIVGVIAAFAQGWTMPGLLVLFGEAISELAKPDPMPGIEELAIYFCYVGLGAAVTACIQRTIFIYLSQRIISKTRHAYIQALLRQDMGWHDERPAAGLEIRIVDAAPKIKTAIGPKFGNVFMQSGTVIGGLIFAFYYSPTLAGISIGALVPTFFAIGGQVSIIEGFESTKQKMYEGAGIVAHEVLTLIRVVSTYGTYDREIDRYVNAVSLGAKKGKVWGRKAGAVMALPDATFQLIYALMFYQGGVMIREGDIVVGDILLVFFCVLMAVFTGAIALQYLKDLNNAKVAAYGIFEVIDRKSEIDGLSTAGFKPDKIKGTVNINNLQFAYPTAPDTPVLKGLSLVLEKGKTIALVGHSGCGKSTIINMLLRFYDPTGGNITVDGRDMKDYNVGWLRQRIGLVAQQPVLLPGSIYDNIAMGKKDATAAEIEAAARAANAHEFISNFPDKYETEVGSLGGKLSGGQKQRIAIARTMIAQPDILLLDEATSALDKRSEATFQQLLEQGRSDRATLVIAHRLSTIQDADEIVVIDHGNIVERGDHATLMKNKGPYFEMHNAKPISRTNTDLINEKNSEALDGFDKIENKLKDIAEDQGVSMEEIPEKVELDDDDYKDEKTKKNLKKQEIKEMKSFLWTFSKGELPIMSLSVLGACIHGASISAGFIILGLTLEVVAGSFELRSSQCNVTPGNSLGVFIGSDASYQCQQSEICFNNRNCWGCTYSGLGSFTAVSSCNVLLPCTEPSSQCAFEQTYPAEEDDLNPLIFAFIVSFGTLFIGKYLQTSSELVSSDSITARLRTHFFKTFLRKSAAWQDQYTTSEMTEVLAVSCTDGAKLTSLRWGKIANAAAVLVCSFGAAFYYCPKLAGVVVAVLPLLIATQASDMSIQLGLDKEEEGKGKNKTPEQIASADAAVIMENVRDITALGRAHDILDNFEAKLSDVNNQNGKKILPAGFTAFITQIVMFGQWALAFWYGGRTLADGSCDFGDMNIAFIAILFSGFQVGQEMAFIPDAAAATERLVQAHQMIKNIPQDEIKEKSATKPIGVSGGKIEFRNVKFSYPTRKEATVLSNFSLTIEPGKTVALVGGSGSGKSTTIGLVQKLYHPDEGTIFVDGQDISQVSTDELRKQIAVVPQEPKLFNMSVRDNIAYRPQLTPVTQQAVEAAASVANSTDFINRLDGNYDYTVGKFGEKLSGGQRQRIAIARAIFGDKSIKILLLDEATSALDNQNEAIVQEALNKASEGRTTIIIAHRLSTIQDADCIHVLKDGQVVESGTFDELLAKQGAFAELYQDAAVM